MMHTTYPCALVHGWPETWGPVRISVLLISTKLNFPWYCLVLLGSHPPFKNFTVTSRILVKKKKELYLDYIFYFCQNEIYFAIS